MGEHDVAILTEKMGALKEDFLSHEDQCERSKAEIFSRLQRIERLIFMGLGGLGAVSALATFFGWNILKVLGH